MFGTVQVLTFSYCYSKLEVSSYLHYQDTHALLALPFSRNCPVIDLSSLWFNWMASFLHGSQISIWRTLFELSLCTMCLAIKLRMCGGWS